MRRRGTRTIRLNSTAPSSTRFDSTKNRSFVWNAARLYGQLNNMRETFAATFSAYEAG